MLSHKKTIAAIGKTATHERQRLDTPGFSDEEVFVDETGSFDEQFEPPTVSSDNSESIFAQSPVYKKNGTTEGEHEPPFTIAANETKAVVTLRVILWILIITATVSVCGIAYRNAYSNETRVFHEYVRILSDKLIESFESTTAMRFGMMEQFSLSVTAYVRNKNDPSVQWPFVTIPDFEIMARQVALLAQLMSIALVILVKRENQQAYLDFSRNDTSQMDGLAIQRGVHVSSIDPVPPFPQIVRTTSNGFEPDDSPGPYMLYAINYPSMPNQWKNINLLGYKGHGPTLQSLLHLGLPAFSESLDFIDPSSRSNRRYNFIRRNLNVTGYETAAGLRYENDPVMPIFIPIFRDLPFYDELYNRTREVVGALRMGVYWRTYFRDALPSGSDGLIVVLRNTCSQEYTYQVNGGDATFLSRGDVHDVRYDHLGSKVAVFAANHAHAPGCEYTIQVFPSDFCEQQFRSAKPLQISLGFGCAFLFTSFVFLMFDYCVRRRQRIVLTSALKSGKIVNCLYPESVRERVYQETSLWENYRGVGVTKNERIERGAILTHHPEATVCFSDLAGFTEWSCQKSAASVFYLLESLYASFDALAKENGVFKVETIGDSHLTFCANANNTHALIMVRFARSCLNEFRAIMARLSGQKQLGPGIERLSIRFGLHSGEVVGGVVRGDKPRFQIFGCTVNTASRMEQHSQPGKIQVSSATASILKQKGREDLLQEREHLVIAKGLDPVQTFWINEDALP